MLVFLYAFHDCDYHKAVPQNKSARFAWQKAAACKRTDLKEACRLVQWLRVHKAEVSYTVMGDRWRIYYSERGPLL